MLNYKKTFKKITLPRSYALVLYLSNEIKLKVAGSRSYLKFKDYG